MTKKLTCFSVVVIVCFTVHELVYAASILYVNITDKDFKEYEVKPLTLYLIYAKLALVIPFLFIFCVRTTARRYIILITFHIINFLLSTAIFTSYFAKWRKSYTASYEYVIGFFIIQNIGMLIIDGLALYYYLTKLVQLDSHGFKPRQQQDEKEKNEAYELFHKTKSGTRNNNVERKPIQSPHASSNQAATSNLHTSPNTSTSNEQHANPSTQLPKQRLKKPQVNLDGEDPGFLNTGYDNDDVNSMNSFTSSTDENLNSNTYGNTHSEVLRANSTGNLHFIDHRYQNVVEGHVTATKPSYDMNILTSRDQNHQNIYRVKSAPDISNYSIKSGDTSRRFQRSQTTIEHAHDGEDWPPLPPSLYENSQTKSSNLYRNHTVSFAYENNVPPSIPTTNTNLTQNKPASYENTQHSTLPRRNASLAINRHATSTPAPFFAAAKKGTGDEVGRHVQYPEIYHSEMSTETFVDRSKQENSYNQKYPQIYNPNQRVNEQIGDRNQSFLLDNDDVFFTGNAENNDYSINQLTTQNNKTLIMNDTAPLFYTGSSGLGSNGLGQQQQQHQQPKQRQTIKRVDPYEKVWM